MSIFLFLLICVCSLALIIGLFKPVFVLPKKLIPSRGKVILIWGSAVLGIFIIWAILLNTDAALLNSAKKNLEAGKYDAAIENLSRIEKNFEKYDEVLLLKTEAENKLAIQNKVSKDSTKVVLPESEKIVDSVKQTTNESNSNQTEVSSKNKTTPLQEKFKKISPFIDLEKSKVGNLLVTSQYGIRFYTIDEFESRALFKVVCPYFYRFPDEDKVIITYEKNNGGLWTIEVNKFAIEKVVGKKFIYMDIKEIGEVRYNKELAKKAFNTYKDVN